MKLALRSGKCCLSLATIYPKAITYPRAMTLIYFVNKISKARHEVIIKNSLLKSQVCKYDRARQSTKKFKGNNFVKITRFEHLTPDDFFLLVHANMCN